MLTDQHIAHSQLVAHTKWRVLTKALSAQCALMHSLFSVEALHEVLFMNKDRTNRDQPKIYLTNRIGLTSVDITAEAI